MTGFSTNPRRRRGTRPPENAVASFVVELNPHFQGGLERARLAFELLYAGEVERLTRTYLRCDMSHAEARALGERHRRLIRMVWPDFVVRPLVDRSVRTIRAHDAQLIHPATGKGITWAVVDSGIDVRHLHFGNPCFPLTHTLLHPSVAELHRDFTARSNALIDDHGHGTHVAGIIAGGVGPDVPSQAVAVHEHALNVVAERTLERLTALRGVAPACRLVSLRVLNRDGEGLSSDVIRALEYIRHTNRASKDLAIHGVNLSVGYELDFKRYACGQSPLCVTVNRLVASGVVVVAGAGNIGLPTTINDPGNASLAISVGSTHRDTPDKPGVSYFSSKGPTGDGRLKPDLVAPGEYITSCASPSHLRRLGVRVNDERHRYIDESGTSQAAAHVSGAIASFLSVHPELIGRPEQIKKIFLDSATPLGRERTFEGHGLVDLLGAIEFASRPDAPA